MKPKQIAVYETTNGITVKTVAEWKRAEMVNYLSKCEPLVSGVVETIQPVADYLIAHSGECITILSVREPKGRPAGAKDRAPRKSRKTATPTDQPGGAAQ